jgi:hypothetical protein
MCLKAVYVRESAILPRLDDWLCRLFDPENLDETCEALSMAGRLDEGATGRHEAARRNHRGRGTGRQRNERRGRVGTESHRRADQDALAAKKAAGVRLGRPPVLDPVVRVRIQAEKKAGRSLVAIAKALEAEGVPTARGGIRWHASSVRQIVLAA